MSFALNEIEATANKAARGAGLDWGIAEEAGKVVPQIVDWDENSEYANGLEYSRITCILVEAVKEQQKQIDSLKQEILLLKSEKKDV